VASCYRGEGAQEDSLPLTANGRGEGGGLVRPVRGFCRAPDRQRLVGWRGVVCECEMGYAAPGRLARRGVCVMGCAARHQRGVDATWGGGGNARMRDNVEALVTAERVSGNSTNDAVPWGET